MIDFWQYIRTLYIVLTMMISAAHAQNSDYFFENNYADYPIITFQENFWGNPKYTIDGNKIKASEVRAFMEIMPGDAKEFMQQHRQTLSGTSLGYASSAVALGGVYYLSKNINNINPQVIRNSFFFIVGGSLLGSIGAQMKINGIRKVNSLVDNHNYLIRQDEISGPYLRFDYRNNLIGQKIDIYDGPNLLTRGQLEALKNKYPELQLNLQKARNAQRLSQTIDVLSLASNIVFITYVVTPRFQSSAPSNFLIPLSITDLALSFTSPLISRSARNRTRVGLQNFNFRE